MAVPEHNEELKIGFGEKRKTMIDSETGELVTVSLKTVMPYGEESYKRAYKSFFKMCYEFVDSAKAKTLFYILSSLGRKQSVFYAKPDKITAETGLSRSSVFEALKEIEKENFVKKVQTGVWMVNPNLISDADEVARKRQIQKYCEIGERPKEE